MNTRDSPPQHKRLCCLYKPIREMYYLLFSLLLVGVLSHAQDVKKDSPIHVAFIHPKGFLFWDAYREFLEGVSEDLGIVTTRFEVMQRGDSLHAVKKLAQRVNKPDYLIFYYQDTIGVEMIRIAHDAGIRIFIVNTDITAGDKEMVGSPRSIYSSWIGHLLQDDFEVGYKLADLLIEKHSSLNLESDTHKSNIQLAAISGNKNSTASIERNKGFNARLYESKNFKLTRLIETTWRSHEAERAAYELLNIYPDISMFLAASDAIAVGIIDGVKRHSQYTLGKNILVGSIDWSKQGISEVANGNIAVNVGGHFMHGGWALVLINDYHKGIDFAEELGTTVHLPLEAIDADNVQQYVSIFQHERWKKIDFRHFSKYHTPSLKKYDFSLDKLFMEYERVSK